MGASTRHLIRSAICAVIAVCAPLAPGARADTAPPIPKIGAIASVKLDRYSYDPSSGSGSGLIDMFVGAYSFISGKMNSDDKVKLERASVDNACAVTNPETGNSTQPAPSRRQEFIHKQPRQERQPKSRNNSG